MKKRQRIEKRRVLYVGPIGAGVLGASAALPMAALGLAFDHIGSVETAAGSVAGTALSFVLGAWMFNLMGPLFGGLHLWLAPLDVKVDQHAPVIVCPRCGTESPRTRTFCSECDHDFEGAEPPDSAPA